MEEKRSKSASNNHARLVVPSVDPVHMVARFPAAAAQRAESIALRSGQISGSEQSVIFSNYWFTFLSENSQHAVSALWHFGGVQPTDGSGEIHRSRPAMTMNCPAEPGNGTCLVASLRKAEACRAHFTSTFSCPSTNPDGIKGMLIIRSASMP
uniref:Uncharacterized protein n=1 Tax=Anopheles coluzzii TaxID=1518534 RepID=A0A8W7PE43_ANOCL